MRLFDFKSRAARKEYFLHTFFDGIIICAFIFSVLFFTISDEEGIVPLIFNIIGITVIVAVIFVGIISEIAVTVRRLHDLGRPGSHYWLLMIPIYNFFLSLVLLFSKGIPDHNSYGPDPLNRE